MGDDNAEDLSLSHLPEWTNVCELLTAIEDQLGRQVRDQIEVALDRDPDEMINVRELLADIQTELGPGSYFNTLLQQQDEEGEESGVTSQDNSRGS